MQHQKQINNFPIYLYIDLKKELPILIIRRETQEPAAIRALIMAAWENKPVIVFPTFKNKLNAVSKLIENKVIRKDANTEEYEFIL